MTLQQAINEFINSRRLMGCTDVTIIDYTYFLSHFHKWLDCDTINILTLDTFMNYTDYLLNSDVRRVTVRTYLTHLRTFYRWLADEGLININTSKLRLPKKSVSIIDVLTDEEVNTLLECVSGNDFLSVRNRLIVSLMLDCGLRRSDIVNLKVTDVRSNYLILNGKGQKQRIVPYGKNVSTLINTYLKFNTDNEYLFVTNAGEPITANAIKMFFQHLKLNTGISRLKPHLLRHTFATNYILNGGSLEMLRLILGHTTLTTTQIYLHLAETKKLISQAHISHLDIMKRTTEQ